MVVDAVLNFALAAFFFRDKIFVFEICFHFFYPLHGVRVWNGVGNSGSRYIVGLLILITYFIKF